MEIADIVQGGGLVIGGVALGKLIDAGLKVWSARNQRAEVRPQEHRENFPVDVADKYVTRHEFEQHVRDNAGDHENLFARMAANDKLTSRLEGILEGIRDDLKAITDKLFKTRS